MKEHYETLKKFYTKAQQLQSIDYLLMWDAETKMPKKGASYRSELKKLIANLLHETMTNKEVDSSLKALEKTDLSKEFDQDQIIAIERFKEEYEKENKLSPTLVGEIAQATGEASHVWTKARRMNNFSLFQPHLEKIIILMQKKAEALGYEKHPYDALIDLYEPKMTSAILDKLFEKVKPRLKHLLQNAKAPEDDFLYGQFDVEQQKAFSCQLLKDMGHKEDGFRLDLSTHPFCLPLGDEDIRMTTRIQSSEFLENILAVLHEGGHGLYEANIGEESLPNILNRHLSIAMHESQSKFWECCIGMSYSFWEGYYPRLQETFPEALNKVDLDSFYKAVNRVKPSLIRVSSDEVSYNLHVILRYEIEKGFIDGSYKAKDLPDIWKEKMQGLIGIVPETDREGCLQDIHWSLGFIGYFPTYALGTFYAAQLYEAFSKQYPDKDTRLQQGNLLFVKDWLAEHVHKHGRKYTSSELLKKETGSEVSPDAFIHYLENKYKAL